MVMLSRTINAVGIYCFNIYTFLMSNIGPKMRKPITEPVSYTHLDVYKRQALATTCVSSSIFLTGAAPNPLALELSAKSGIVAANWGTWFLAFLPVGLILFIITPLLTYVFCKPEVKGSPEIAAWAKDEYKKLGSDVYKRQT